MPDQEAFDACLRRGQSAYQSGRWDEAAREYEQACGLNPSSAPAACDLGRSLVRLRRLDDAIRQFQKALSLDALHASSLYHLALCLDTKGVLESALPAYERFLQSAPPDSKYADKARKRVGELKPGQALTAGQKDGTLTMGPGNQGTMTMGPGLAPVSDMAVAGWSVGEVVDDLYKVESVLGEGGFGAVHKVRHLGWDMDLAVKSPREDKVSNRRAMERFVAEANTWVGLGFHPNIVTCYFVRLMGGLPRIFIEYIEAGTLSEWLKSRKIMDAKIAMDVSIQLARAMERVHGRGLIHRDLKPGNCLMTPGGTLKVTDFGLAKIGPLDEAPEPEGVLDEKAQRAKARETIATGGLGTPEYMAPEQWCQAGKATAAADVWAFGVMLCEIMHAKPFRMADDEPPDAFHFRMLEEKWKYKFREDAPGELKDIISSCLNPEPRNRKTQFGVLRSRLEALYASLFKESYPRPSAKETPLLADTLSNQGVSLADLGHAEEALKLFAAALRQDPTHPGALYNEGVLRLKQGGKGAEDLSAKLDGCRRARPKEWVPRYLLGLARLQGKDKKSGIKELKDCQVLTGSPLVKRALRLAEGSKPEEALELFVSLPVSAEAAQEEEARFNALLARARKEADSGDSGKAYATLMEARAVRGYGRAPLALSLQQRLSSKGVRKSLRAAWRKLSYEDSRGALCAAVSADGTQAVSGHEDGSVRVWELESGKPVSRDDLKKGPVFCAIFKPDGGALPGRPDDWKAVAIAPDGQSLWAGDRDGSLGHCRLSPIEEVGSVQAHTGSCQALAVSPDGVHVLSAGDDGGLKVWGAKSLKLALWARVPTQALGLAVSGRHGCAFLACADGSLRKWRPEMGNRAIPACGATHAGPVRSLALTPEEGFLLSAGGKNELKLADLESGKCVWSSEEHKGRILGAVFSPDARYALSCGEDGIHLWELDWEYEFPPPGSQPRERKSAGLVFDLARVPAQAEAGKPGSNAKSLAVILAGAVLAVGLPASGLVLYRAFKHKSSRPAATFPAVEAGPVFEARPETQAGPEPAPVEPAPQAQAPSEPEAPAVPAAFADLLENGSLDAAKLYRRGLELERKGRLVEAYAAFRTCADAGMAEAGARKVALNPKLGKGDLVEALRLSRALAAAPAGGGRSATALGAWLLRQSSGENSEGLPYVILWREGGSYAMEIPLDGNGWWRCRFGGTEYVVFPVQGKEMQNFYLHPWTSNPPSVTASAGYSFSKKGHSGTTTIEFDGGTITVTVADGGVITVPAYGTTMSYSSQWGKHSCP